MLSAADITRMRRTVQTVLPGTAVLYTAAGTADGMGGITTGWAAAGTVACRIDYKGDGDEPLTADAIRATGDYMMTVADTVTVPESGRVEHAGSTYDVVAMLTVDPWDLCQRVGLVRVR